MKKTIISSLSLLLFTGILGIYPVQASTSTTDIEVASLGSEFDGRAGSTTINTTQRLLGTYPLDYQYYLFDGKVDGNIGWISREVTDSDVKISINFTSSTLSKYYGSTAWYEYTFYR